MNKFLDAIKIKMYFEDAILEEKMKHSKRNAHQALANLDKRLMKESCQAVVYADDGVVHCKTEYAKAGKNMILASSIRSPSSKSFFIATYAKKISSRFRFLDLPISIFIAFK